MRNFENNYKTVVITGASGGLGQAFFSQLRKCKKIFLISNKNMPFFTCVPDNVFLLQADFSYPDQVYNLVSILQQEDVDLLIHCAGFGKFGSVLSLSIEETESILNVNAVAPILITQGLLEKIISVSIKNNTRAGIIIVSSVVGLMSMPYLAIYAAAKAAIINYGDALVEELKEQPIDILVSCPGSMRTLFAEKAGLHKNLVSNAPEPIDIAKEALFCLGRKNFFIHGIVNRKRIRDARCLGRDNSRKHMAVLVKKAMDDTAILKDVL